MKASERGVHRWYIEPLDARTNEVLAKSQDFICNEQVVDGVRCEDGQSHKLWECPNYAFIAELQRSKVQLLVVFRVWHQDGKGKIRLWNFPRKTIPFEELKKKMTRPKMVHDKP